MKNRPPEVTGRPVAYPADDVRVSNTIESDRLVLKILDQRAFQFWIKVVLQKDVQRLDEDLAVR